MTCQKCGDPARIHFKTETNTHSLCHQCALVDDNPGIRAGALLLVDFESWYLLMEEDLKQFDMKHVAWSAYTAGRIDGKRDAEDIK